MRLLGTFLVLSLAGLALAEPQVMGLKAARDNMNDVWAMLGFRTNVRRDELQSTLDEVQDLNKEIEPLLEKIDSMMKPIRTHHITRSEERLSLAKMTAAKHAERARKISNLGDQGIQSMQDVSDFLVKGAEFLDVLSMRAPDDAAIREHLDGITKAQRDVDKLLAITVTYALRANQRAYEAEEATKKVQQSALLRNAIDHVMEAETAAAQAGEVAQAIVINERIANAQGQRYSDFFIEALSNAGQVDTKNVDPASFVEDIDTTDNDQIIAPGVDTELELRDQIDTALNRLRTLKTSASIYVESARAASADAKDLMSMLGALSQDNEKLSAIADSRAQSLEVAEKASAASEKDFNTVSIAIAIAEKVSERAQDAESLRAALTTTERKIKDVEALLEKLRMSKELAEKKKSDIFGTIRSEFSATPGDSTSS